MESVYMKKKRFSFEAIGRFFWNAGEKNPRKYLQIKSKFIVLALVSQVLTHQLYKCLKCDRFKEGT